MTDGFVIGPLDGDWKLGAWFVNSSNLDTWYAYGQAGEQIKLTPYMVGLSEVTFEIPEPSSFICMARLFAMAFFASWWRERNT